MKLMRDVERVLDICEVNCFYRKWYLQLPQNPRGWEINTQLQKRGK